MLLVSNPFESAQALIQIVLFALTGLNGENFHAQYEAPNGRNRGQPYTTEFFRQMAETVPEGGIMLLISLYLDGSCIDNA